jgi:hypothetical protein
VGPGPAPLTGQAWVRQVAIPGPPRGEWAFVDQPALGPLPEPLVERLRSPGGERGRLRSAVIAPDGKPTGESAPDELYLACLDAAVELVAARLEDETVREEPRSSGIVAMRLRTDGADVMLDIAPAVEEEGWLGRSIRVDLAALRLEGPDWHEPGPPEVEFGDATVTAAGRPVVLPCAVARWPFQRGPGEVVAASLPVSLPSAWLPGVPEPLLRVALRA